MKLISSYKEVFNKATIKSIVINGKERKITITLRRESDEVETEDEDGAVVVGETH